MKRSKRVPVTVLPPGPESQELQFQRWHHDANLGGYQRALTILPSDFYRNYLNASRESGARLADRIKEARSKL